MMRILINVFFLLFLSLCLQAQNDYIGLSLDGSWRLYYGQYSKDVPSTPDELKSKHWPEVPAIVPGNVELDLLKAGLIANPEVGNNVYALRKYEAYQWWYYNCLLYTSPSPRD